MPGLVLKLAPNEGVYLNGVLIRNGDRRACLNIVTRNAKILREREMLPKEEAEASALHSVVFRLQAFLAGIDDDRERLIEVLADASPFLPELDPIDEFKAGRGYKVFKDLRAQLPVAA